MQRVQVRARGARALAAAGAAAMLGACDLDFWPDGNNNISFGDQPAPVLQPRYVLTSVNGTPLPFTITDATTRTRLLADTLIFAGAGAPPGVSGTYVEVRTVGVQQGSAAEVVTRTTSPARAWRQSSSYALLLVDDFTGLAGSPMQVTVYLGNADRPTQPVYFNVATGSYAFEPR